MLEAPGVKPAAYSYALPPTATLELRSGHWGLDVGSEGEGGY